jgi:hypothetical protein
MERIELLRARIALYRRYLSEGTDGDTAKAYLWLIRQDEIKLTAIAVRQEQEQAQVGAKEKIREERSNNTQR